MATNMTFGLVSSSKKKKPAMKLVPMGELYPGVIDDNRRIRCNMCMKTFPEEKVLVNPKTDKEYCPYCHKSGFLMDL